MPIPMPCLFVCVVACTVSFQDSHSVWEWWQIMYQSRAPWKAGIGSLFCGAEVDVTQLHRTSQSQHEFACPGVCWLDFQLRTRSWRLAPAVSDTATGVLHFYQCVGIGMLQDRSVRSPMQTWAFFELCNTSLDCRKDVMALPSMYSATSINNIPACCSTPSIIAHTMSFAWTVFKGCILNNKVDVDWTSNPDGLGENAKSHCA